MPTYKFNINDTGTVLQQMNVTFERMSVILPDIEHSALKSGAMSLKEKVKEAFISKLPSASRPIQHPYKNYQGTALVEGVRQSKVDEKYNTVKVHILGSKGQDMTWITRMYEYPTQERYTKTFKGKKLKTKRRTGHLQGYHFFIPTVQTELSNVTQHMAAVCENKINKVLGNG